MSEYTKAKWKTDFPDRAGQEVRPAEAIDNTLDYDVNFPQYLSEDPVVFNQQNKTVSQLVSNDARLYERISATSADITAHMADPKAHANGISGNAGSADQLKTARKIHRVPFDGTKDITLPDFTGCGEKTAGTSGMVPAPGAGKIHTVLHGSGAWGKVTYADMDEEAVEKIQACPFPVNSVYISVDGTNPAKYWPGTTWVAFGVGRCLIGAGTADSGTMYKAGDKLGEEKHTISVNEMPAHTHTGNTDYQGNHNHNRGSMNITGTLCLPTHSGRWNGNVTGAFQNGGDLGKEGADFDETWKWHDVTYATFDASRTWSGVTNTAGNHRHGFTTDGTGGGQAHNNMQPSVVVYFFQRTD